MYDDQFLLREADLAHSIARFNSTPVGIYLMERAKADREAAKMDLLTVDPTDAKAVQEIQNRARVADSFREWLRAGIEAGIAAEAALHESEWTT